MDFSNIIVGGGTAGAVLAGRLSEEPDKQVLLLEAGPDYPHTTPAELLDASFVVTNGHNWQMEAILHEGSRAPTGEGARVSKVFQLASGFLRPEENLQNFRTSAQRASFPYPLGKLVGGGSAINGCLALHARPEDYESWAAAGNDKWSWEHVRPCISRIAAADCGKPALPIETLSPRDLSSCQRAFLDTCRVLGENQVDLSQGSSPGVGIIPKNVYRGKRVSSSALYLSAARSRANLTIQPNCLVNRLLLETRSGSLSATGVEVFVDGIRRQYSGEHITVSAGAIHSPAILMRSGIGPAGRLAQRKIKPLLDLPGVGENLQDHPAVIIWGTPRSGSCLAGEPVHQVMLQQRSPASDGLCDVQLFMLSAVPTHDIPILREMVGSNVALGISAVLATPRSRGRVEVVDSVATTNPHIYLNCLHDRQDIRRMMEGVRSAWFILRHQPLHLQVGRILLWTQNIIDSDVLLERLIRATVRTTWHPMGTLRMGKEGDAMAVVDQYGRIFGCRNVTVADASIMPTIPSVPLNLTCMLIGERIAAHLRGLEA